MQLLACIVILVISSIFLGLWHGFYTLATYILPPILSFLLTAFAFYHLILDMCRRFTFPGSTWLWRRNIENHYQKAFVIKTRKKLILLKSLVLYIGEGNNIWKDLIPNYERKEIAKTLALVLNLYGKQAMHNTLTKRQKVMMNQFNDIDNALRLTKLNGKASGKSISFWEFLEDAKRDMEHLEPHLNFVFEDENMGTHLLEKCKALEARLHDIICEKGCFANMKRFLFENSFGTIDHMREELDNKYKCQRISLKVSGNNTIDCLLVSKKVEHEEESSVLPSKDPQAIEMTHLNRRDISSKLTQATSIKNKTVGPTMILCCPNAGYYEYMCYESQWIDIYIKHGFNVLLWNYRGYGRSTGKPDPQAMRSDGEAIVDYLRENMGVEVIGCHGESIGGLVATHIARWKDIDFLCADRSFESLFTIGRLVVGKGMCSFYRILTGWDDRLTLDFLETKCYKVITFDPKDEVIPFICSLRHGISKRISQEILGFYTGEPIRPVQKGEHWIISPRAWILRCKKLIHSIRTEIFLNKLEKQSKKDYGILKKMHMNAFYNAFTRIFDLFECYSALRNHMNIKKHRRIISAGGLPQLSTPMKLLPPAHAGDQGNASPESVKEGPDENLSPSNVSIIAGNRDRHECGTHSELGIERISNHSNQSQGYPEYDIDYSASLEKEPYEKLFDDEAQKDPDFIVFLESIFTSFELFELGGVQIENIMMVPLLERFDAFKHFLNSLWIWGAYLPLHQTVKEGATDISYHQEKAIKKIKILIRRLDNTARTERLKEKANAVPSPYKNLKNAILDDLELIISILPMLTNNATKMWEEERERGKTATNQIELIPRKTRDALTAPLLDLQVDVEKEYKRDYGSTVGHLIPLCCGHNGNLRPLEVEMYEYYLKNAGLT